MKKNLSFWVLLSAMFLLILPIQAKTYKMSIDPGSLGSYEAYCYVWGDDDFAYFSGDYGEYSAENAIAIVEAEYDETTGWLSASFETDAASLTIGWSTEMSSSTYMYWYSENYDYYSYLVREITESSYFAYIMTNNNYSRLEQVEYYPLVPDDTNSFTINLTEAGTLGIKMMLAFDDYTIPWALTITGPLNDDDMSYFSKLTQLRKLDLKDAEFTTMKNCSGLTQLREVVLPNSATKIDVSAFYDCHQLTKINMDNIVTISNNAFQNCYNLNNLTLNNVVSVGNYAFNSCSSLESISLPACSSLGTYAFNYCSSLHQVVLSDDIYSIPNYCFSNCTNLKEFNFPPYLGEIGYNAFYNVPLTEVVLPDGIYSVGSSNFNKAASITLPASLSTFSSSSSTWQDVYCYHAVPPTFGFESNSSVAYMTLHVPAFSLLSYKTAANWLNFGSIVAMEGDVDKLYINSEYSLYSIAGISATADLSVDAGGVLVSEELDNKTLKLGMYQQTIGTDYTFNRIRQYDENGNSLYDETGNYLYKYTKALNNSGVLYVKSPISADAVHFAMVARTNRWNFISLPFDVDVKDIVADDGVKWVIREYSTENRALGTGSTWQNVSADATLQAKKGYILYCEDPYSSYYYYDYTSYAYFRFPAANNTRQNTFASTDQQVSLQHYEAEFAQDQSWNLVGNPFPCMFDMSEMDFTGPITIYLPGGNVYTAFSPLDDNYHFRPGEAFFVQAPDDISAITFRAAGREKTMSCEITSAEYADRSKYAPARLPLSKENERKVFNFIVSGKDFSDRARIVFNEQAKAEYEVGRDAAKMFSNNAEIPQLFVYDNNVQYAICERPIQNGEVILGVAAPTKGQYTLALNSTTDDYIINLYDTKTGIASDLSKGSYTFNIETGVDNGRFRIRFTRAMPTSIETVSSQSTIKVNGQNIEITAEQPADITVYTIDGKVVCNRHGQNLHLTLTTGVYVANIDGCSHKLVVK